MDVAPTVSQATEVPVDPSTAFRLYTAEINRWWRLDTPYWNDRERAIGLRMEPWVGGRFVEVIGGWERVTGGEEIGRGYGSGSKELLAWYAEAAATA
jgi:hypothetical protein